MNKKVNAFFKFVFVLCFVSFLTFYFSLSSGYYEYNNRRKMSFTKEQIEKFESDVSSGKSISVGEYLNGTNKNYQNKISRTTLGVSEAISSFAKKGMNAIFSRIENAIENG